MGLTRALEAIATRPTLVVLNYHRIGDRDATLYDPHVFSTTQEGFEAQIALLQRRYRVVSLAEATAIITGATRPRGVAVLLTFDDGYLDNYTAAFPVLAARGVPATFFLVTSEVGTSHIPRWDRVAWAVRHAPPGVVRLRSPYDLTLDLRSDDRVPAVKRALLALKSRAVADADDFVSAVVEACDAAPPTAPDRVYMSWSEVAEMAKGGMDIGSHTHTHRILSRLSREEQLSELETSRRVLAERLGLDVTACAYPDGLPTTWNDATLWAMREAGYRIGFTFHGGSNLLPHPEPLEVSRTVVSPTVTLPQLRLRLSLAGLGQDAGF